MSGEGSATDRLEYLVKTIARELLCEVCTVYILRAGEVLELFATGSSSAIHQTRGRKPGGEYRC